MWPYVLFLPEDAGKRRDFIRRVLASKVAPGILAKFDEDGRVLQKDLVQELSHSNRSILAYLKVLQEFDLVETTTLVESGKRIVAHSLTRRGWGLARFFSEGIPADFNELTEYLLEDYLLNLINLYREKGLEISTLFEIFSRTRARAMLQSSSTHPNPDFTLFGASAFFTRIDCSKWPVTSEEVGCTAPVRYPGGPSVELALALANDGHQVIFSSSVGNDQDGWNLISELLKCGVDVSNIAIESERLTNQTIIIDVNGVHGTLVGIGEHSALSLTSPSQVSWDSIKKSKAIYLGEVFLEVAVSIAAFAQSSGIPVVYRCSPHYWKRGLQELTPVLSQIDILLMSPKEWYEAKKILGAWPIKALRGITKAAIIARTDDKAFRVSLDGTTDTKECQSDFESDDLTLPFTTELLKSIADGKSAVDAFEIALDNENQPQMES
jgi:sugar/nucleoside kinase (ribokinase family)